jgi:propanol-preferring alcohol dehydrogenase
VTAVSIPAFAQALRIVRRKGTVSLVGLPPGEFPTPIFDVAALSDINGVFDDLRAGKIDGRVVLDLA